MIVQLFIVLIVLIFLNSSLSFRIERLRRVIMRRKSLLLSMENEDKKGVQSGREDEIRASLKASREVSEPLTPQAMSETDDNWLESFKEKRPYISILVERAVQTIDDYQVAKKVKEQLSANGAEFSTTRSIEKKKIVVLGTGWGAHSFLKSIDTTQYDIKVVSPRNYFMFTPMLAASAVGTVEFRSICEPIRNVNPLIEYVEAVATEIDTKGKRVSCRSIK